MDPALQEFVNTIQGSRAIQVHVPPSEFDQKDRNDHEAMIDMRAVLTELERAPTPPRNVRFKPSAPAPPAPASNWIRDIDVGSPANTELLKTVTRFHKVVAAACKEIQGCVQFDAPSPWAFRFPLCKGCTTMAVLLFLQAVWNNRDAVPVAFVADGQVLPGQQAQSVQGVMLSLDHTASWVVCAPMKAMDGISPVSPKHQTTYKILSKKYKAA